MRGLAGVECVDTLDCVREQVRIAGVLHQVTLVARQKMKLTNFYYIDEEKFVATADEL